MNCGIIVGRWQMFVAFVGNLYPRIYILTNVYIYIFASICLIFFYKIKLATNEITSPRTKKNLATHEYWSWPPQLKMIPRYMGLEAGHSWIWNNYVYWLFVYICIYMYLCVQTVVARGLARPERWCPYREVWDWGMYLCSCGRFYWWESHLWGCSRDGKEKSEDGRKKDLVFNIKDSYSIAIVLRLFHLLHCICIKSLP